MTVRSSRTYREATRQGTESRKTMFPWIKKLLTPEFRIFISLVLGMGLLFTFIHYVGHYEDKNWYAVCTVKSARVEIVGGQVSNMTDTSPKGIFETDECGVIEMYNAPDGKNIPEYVSQIQTGKKYKMYKTWSTRNDERNFNTLRLEEIKE
ncbi:hypothetical protein [Rothia mucilaginosa]|uniref:hypothetical protein n=1 Tax=Rothia mucilaginosa TaxID=43675 RepID=UPI0026F325A7|nr:hypothetical protein [Rothia mucilaginosa]